MMTDNKDLIARLEGADGPDRKLDLLIWRLFRPDDYRDSFYSLRASCPKGSTDEYVHGKMSSHVRYTASFDASIALVDEVLPGWEWALEKEDTTYDGETAPLFRFELGSQIQEEHKSLAIVPLIALLKAKG